MTVCVSDSSPPPQAPRPASPSSPFLSHIVPRDFLDAIERRSAREGVPAFDVLMTHRDIDPEAVVSAVARRLGITSLTHAGTLDLKASISLETARAALRTGLLMLPDGRIVIAARGYALSRAVALLRHDRAALGRLMLATPQAFCDCVTALAGADLAEHAATSTAKVDEAFSARKAGFGKAAIGACIFLAIAIIALFVESHYAPIMEILLVSAFLACAALKLTALAAPPLPHDADSAPVTTPDHALPVYSVLVPLYREPACVAGLIRALADLDYPASKLDVKLLVEHDDRETIDAIAACPVPAHFEVMHLPPGAPRTKPRALTIGLAAARGQYLVVYDAEDRPEPTQLRRAVEAFDRGQSRLACVQARLTIDNTADGWLTRMFTIEYAALFDALLPALSRMGAMFPLGGTSNHFRTAALDRVGGWDAWNVTEDADLGVRLARLGLRSTVIASSTYEEAPNRAGAWLKQRTRWMKGYILTWAIHMRHPARLWRELGPRDFFVFQTFIGGVPLCALVLPLFMVSIAWDCFEGDWLTGGASSLSWTLPALALVNLTVGFASAIALAAAGIENRRLGRLRPLLAALPLYWLMGSVAAWRALLQLMTEPHRWEKTEHGLAETSRRIADGALYNRARRSWAISAVERVMLRGETKLPSASIK